MSITLSVDDCSTERGHQGAAEVESLNQNVRDVFEPRAGSAQVECELLAFERSAFATPGRLEGQLFDREEVNRRA